MMAFGAQKIRFPFFWKSFAFLMSYLLKIGKRLNVGTWHRKIGKVHKFKLAMIR
jgi:hypothetical protein